MIPSEQRFSRLEFSEFLKNKGIFIVFNRLGTLKYLPGSPKFSVVTSGKHEKRAVYRNTIRRRLYTLFRSNSAPLQGVLYLAKASYQYTYPEIVTLFNDLITKAQKSAI